MKIITISGKSGSGKSYVAKLIASVFDANLIDIDEISHKTLELENVKNEIKKMFGKGVFDGDNISRKKLSQIVFSSPEKLDFVNNLCWPEIDKIVDERLSNKKINILDYSLLPKMKYFDDSFKILVEANKNVRKNRILTRDKISEPLFELREKNSLKYCKKDFDIVVNNNNDIDKNDIINKINAFLGEKND